MVCRVIWVFFIYIELSWGIRSPRNFQCVLGGGNSNIGALLMTGASSVPRMQHRHSGRQFIRPLSFCTQWRYYPASYGCQMAQAITRPDRKSFCAVFKENWPALFSVHRLRPKYLNLLFLYCWLATSQLKFYWWRFQHSFSCDIISIF